MTLRCLEPSGNGAEGTHSQWGTAGSAEEPSPEAARLAKALRELGYTGWYWGSMTVNEAKEKLKEAPEGTFLIRDSSHSDYLLTISVKTSAGPTNLRIEYQDGKFRLDSIICVKSKLKQFDSVVHLIDYYVQMCKDKRTGPEAPRNGTVHLYLTKPLYTSAPSLQHLCRLTINKCTGTVWGLPLPTRLKDYLEEYKFQDTAAVPPLCRNAARRCLGEAALVSTAAPAGLGLRRLSKPPPDARSAGTLIFNVPASKTMLHGPWEQYLPRGVCEGRRHVSDMLNMAPGLACALPPESHSWRPRTHLMPPTIPLTAGGTGSVLAECESSASLPVPGASGASLAIWEVIEEAGTAVVIPSGLALVRISCEMICLPLHFLLQTLSPVRPGKAAERWSRKIKAKAKTSLFYP
ncbi:PREDICTED: suppressor of cytokine signaling 2 isoform X3 [Chinchilla lanigera]|uniref:suppressor of cytokine signaling 2 isoform X3 n=1 Tax=Chinchilla lanigera TaxID=34839 RepID=UPI0006986415|nr:PREDICTED: suppressor of cytokine signaling 2 isoform X3 [Chinchilla lanigera]